MNGSTPDRGTRKARSLADLIRECGAIVSDMSSRQHLVAAWESLQERDQSCNAKGPLPYTDRALSEFALAYERNSDDPAIVHHLAIAHHARAWDLELAGSPDAPAAWEEALGYWRVLAASGPFWESLKARQLACDDHADPGILDSARRELLEDLLDVHVAFICRYSDSNELPRATAHVEIIRRAKIPPAVKQKLIEKVFQAMTGHVPAARANQEYESALTSLERFLGLFPDYLLALRLYAEVCRDWLSPLSWKEEWPQIVALLSRAEPHVKLLSEHSELREAPLARIALEGMCLAAAQKGHDRGWNGIAESEDGALLPDERERAAVALDLAINWGRRVREPDSGNAWVLAHALRGSAHLHKMAMHELIESDELPDHLLTGALNCCRVSVELMTEAVACCPDEGELRNLLRRELESVFRPDLKRCEGQHRLWRGDGDYDRR